jgi:hypothetical protein
MHANRSSEEEKFPEALWMKNTCQREGLRTCFKGVEIVIMVMNSDFKFPSSFSSHWRVGLWHGKL